ncbi:MAG: TolC family protein [Acidobacteria bacterium]|nr:TolC family protein [Acidobacteriota bacterium]
MNRINKILLQAVSLTLLLSVSAIGQVAQKPEQKAELTRVGVDKAKRISLTLRDALTMALENNRDIEVERLNVQMTDFDLAASRGFYDPALTASIFYDRRNTPVANPLAGGQNGGLLTDNVTGNMSLSQRLQNQGGLLQATFNNDRATTQNVFNAINPQFTSSLNISYTQPLWRNRVTDQGRRQILINKKKLDISDAQFRQRAIEIISQVQRAYWDLVFARRDYEIKSESVDLARTQLKHNERLVEAGSLAPADIISARVELERRNDESEATIDAIQRAENSLKSLMLQPVNSEEWQSELVPVETPQIDTTSQMPLPDAVRLAFQNRPEMEQYRLKGELNKIDLDFFRNQTKPQIDFVVNYGTVGVAGDPRTEANFFTQSNLLLTQRVNDLSRLAGLPLLPITDATPLPAFIIGGNGQSLANLFKNDFRTWRVGLNINLPIRNRTALAQLGRAAAEGKQIDVQKQKLEQNIEVEVRNALQAVETSRRRVEAATNSRINAELQYQSEERKFDAGQSTNFFVLDRQNALSAARGRELKALTDYTKAVAELQRVMSTTLSSNNVSVK